MADPWKLQGFLQAINDWVARDGIEDALKLKVIRWTLELAEDPYPPLASPIPNFPSNHWFAQLPFGSQSGRAVVVTYTIHAGDHGLACVDVSELRNPIIVDGDGLV